MHTLILLLLLSLDTPQLVTLSCQPTGIALQWKVKPTPDLEAFCVVRNRSDGTKQRFWLGRQNLGRSQNAGEDQESYYWLDTNLVHGMTYKYQIQSLASSGDLRKSASLELPFCK